jgi:hypothetical protein
MSDHSARSRNLRGSKASPQRIGKQFGPEADTLERLIEREPPDQ